MGFEQLSVLKGQLAAQAKARAHDAAAKARKPAKTPHAKAPEVAPVVLVIGRLQKRFPKAFPKNPAPKVPLKIGIHKDLIAQSQALRMSEADLLEAIKTWCRGQRYWACMVEDAVRVDLAGQPAGCVRAADAARAQRLAKGRPRPEAPASKTPARAQ